MQMALEEASKCVPEVTAFCVGCVLVVSEFPTPESAAVILSRGFSRQLPGNTHAEANAIYAAYHDARLDLLFPDVPLHQLNLSTIFKFTDIYTTLEPCTFRNSGGKPCADLILREQFRRCIIGAGEPEDLVQIDKRRNVLGHQVGTYTEVVWMKGLENECLRAARRGHET